MQTVSQRRLEASSAKSRAAVRRIESPYLRLQAAAAAAAVTDEILTLVFAS